jgi:hypothetical protein
MKISHNSVAEGCLDAAHRLSTRSGKGPACADVPLSIADHKRMQYTLLKHGIIPVMAIWVSLLQSLVGREITSRLKKFGANLGLAEN